MIPCRLSMHINIHMTILIAYSPGLLGLPSCPHLKDLQLGFKGWIPFLISNQTVNAQN